MFLVFATLHPAAPATVHVSSLAGWLWPAAALALIVACSMVLGSRR